MQPLSLILAKSLSNRQPKSRLETKGKSLEAQVREDGKNTCFERISTHVDHSWIDQYEIESNTSKADKSPVPAWMWDERIRLSFPS